MAAMEIPIMEVLIAGILALADADVARLESLAEAARGVRGPETARERQMAEERLKTLGALIARTRRNLRLLRGAAGYRVVPD